MKITQRFVASQQKSLLCLNKIKVFKLILIIIGAVHSFLACGVKGDPLPPEKPPLLGRGQPTYKKATEEITLPRPPQMILEDEDEEDIDEEDDTEGEE
ncbi:MAG: hypothetical protein KDD40_01080 [Bdellovibrionales bacterium]|nr:hypothetical protein [Bdellovibrionales bacterium]